MNNIEKLTAHLNSLQHPRAVYNALMSLAPVIRKAKQEGQREALPAVLLEAMREVQEQ